jgi:hypothetical protein
MAYRAMAYGPSQGEYTHATMYGPLGKLEQGDIAVSPNLLRKFPMGTRVNAVDPKTGAILRANLRVADTSWYKPGKSTTDSFELWNDEDLGQADLVPVGSGSVPTITTPPTVASASTDPAVQDKIKEMNTLIAMQKQQEQQQQVAPGITSGPAIGSLLSEIYKGGQQAGWWKPPRAQLVKT